jgi:hypothetical protein
VCLLRKTNAEQFHNVRFYSGYLAGAVVPASSVWSLFEGVRQRRIKEREAGVTTNMSQAKNQSHSVWQLLRVYADLKGRTLEEWAEIASFPSLPGTVPANTGRSFFQGRVRVNYSFLSGAPVSRIDSEELVFKFPFAVQDAAQAFADFDCVARAVLKRRGGTGILLVYEKAEEPPE